jgi:hypothetical protein
MFKNEKVYLKEWIDFHLLVGFEHIYMCDDQSTDNPLDVLQYYIDKNLVTYWKSENEVKPSFKQRDYFVKKYGRETYWTAFIDIDEFLYCFNEKDSLIKKLKEYEDYSGLAINHYTFGNSGIKEYDKRYVIEKFVFRSPKEHFENTHIKTISKPSLMLDSDHPHYQNYHTGFAVNEKKK